MKDAKKSPPPPDDAESLEPAATLGEPLDLPAGIASAIPDEGAETTSLTDLAEHDLAGAMAQSLIVTSRNNPNKPTSDDMQRIDVITELVLELTQAIFFLCPDNRDRSLSLTALEDVVTRASKSIYVKEPFGGVRAPALVDQARQRLQAEALLAEGQDER